MPLLCKLEQTSQREALSWCCLRGQVSRTHTHTHTSYIDVSVCIKLTFRKTKLNTNWWITNQQLTILTLFMGSCRGWVTSYKQGFKFIRDLVHPLSVNWLRSYFWCAEIRAFEEDCDLWCNQLFLTTHLCLRCEHSSGFLTSYNVWRLMKAGAFVASSGCVCVCVRERERERRGCWPCTACGDQQPRLVM